LQAAPERCLTALQLQRQRRQRPACAWPEVAGMMMQQQMALLLLLLLLLRVDQQVWGC
jgi:hypothetical protein